jgi:uncharacterized protein
MGRVHGGQGQVSDLYEAGDINTVGGSDHETDDVNDAYENDDDVNDAGADDVNGASGNTSEAVLDYLARSLANDPDAVVINADERGSSVRLSLHVAPEDMGRVIGRRGRTAQAIRTLVHVAGAKDGVQTSVDIVDD